jgi:hypothetical protein
MQRQRQGQRHAMQRVTFARDVPVSLIFCILAMIKCGICSYQCDPQRRLATPRHATPRHATPTPTPKATPLPTPTPRPRPTPTQRQCHCQRHRRHRSRGRGRRNAIGNAMLPFEKRLAVTHQPTLYLEPKWLRCLQCCWVDRWLVQRRLLSQAELRVADPPPCGYG